MPAAVSPTDASSVSTIGTLDASAWPGKRMFGTGGTVATADMNANGTGTPATGSIAEGVGLEGPVSFRQFSKPAYPLGARQRGEEGRVVLEVQVAPDGHPARVALFNSSGFSELDRAAVRAIERALFTPATANGQPIEAQAHITILFRLTN